MLLIWEDGANKVERHLAGLKVTISFIIMVHACMIEVLDIINKGGRACAQKIDEMELSHHLLIPK